MSDKYLSVAFSSEMFKVKPIILKTVEFIRMNLDSIDENDLYDLRLIFSELLVNAVIHGNKNDSHKFVNLSVELENDSVSSVISDEGSGFDHTALLAEARSNKNIFSERGRGIMLVHSLADSMAYNAAGNEIKFCKKVNVNG